MTGRVSNDKIRNETFAFAKKLSDNLTEHLFLKLEGQDHRINVTSQEEVAW